ncbi:unnamed protein product, partial [Polarella glacialis]
DVVLEFYSNLLQEAARVLRVGGRCVLFSNRREALAQAVAAGPWETAGAWLVSRERAGQCQLVALERVDNLPKVSSALSEPQPGEADRLLGGEALSKSEEMRAKWLRMGL